MKKVASILVVDDEPHIIKALKTRLESWGFEVDTAQTGYGAQAAEITCGTGVNVPFIQFTTVPEPTTVALLGLGTLALVCRRNS